MRVDTLRLDDTLRELLDPRAADTLTDQIVLVGGRLLVVSRRKVVHAGVDLGSVITLRDRTELEAALRELDDVRSLTDALRAQQHEFANRMHTLAGLIGLGEHDAAARYALDVSSSSGGLAEDLRARIERPEIAAMLLAKTTIAAERDVELVLTGDSRLPDGGIETNMLLTIVGNLIDNAIDAAVGGPQPAHVTVGLVSDEDGVAITVSDSGPGVAPAVATQIFADGFTTKPAEGTRHRGLGLALVHRLVRRANGTISVEGSTFTVRLPVASPGRVEVGA
jgi:two-component system, CitB family, sensor kinase